MLNVKLQGERRQTLQGDRNNLVSSSFGFAVPIGMAWFCKFRGRLGIHCLLQDKWLRSRIVAIEFIHMQPSIRRVHWYTCNAKRNINVLCDKRRRAVLRIILFLVLKVIWWGTCSMSAKCEMNTDMNWSTEKTNLYRIHITLANLPSPKILTIKCQALVVVRQFDRWS
jgi:hypothetical protein